MSQMPGLRPMRSSFIDKYSTIMLFNTIIQKFLILFMVQPINNQRDSPLVISEYRID